jgi:hypothetical protein
LSIFRRRANKGQAGVAELVPDDTTARQMAERAETFVEMTGELGFTLSFDRDGVVQLDGVIAWLINEAGGSADYILGSATLVASWIKCARFIDQLERVCGSRSCTLDRLPGY